jgi:hypothetical protein
MSIAFSLEENDVDAVSTRDEEEIQIWLTPVLRLAQKLDIVSGTDGLLLAVYMVAVVVVDPGLLRAVDLVLDNGGQKKISTVVLDLHIVPLASLDQVSRAAEKSKSSI